MVRTEKFKHVGRNFTWPLDLSSELNQYITASIEKGPVIDHKLNSSSQKSKHVGRIFTESVESVYGSYPQQKKV